MTPGDIVYGGQLLVAIPIAIAAGLLSFLSPCVLPLVPGYLGYVGGMTSPDEAKTGSGRRRVLLGVSLFILGFTVVFVGAAAFGGLVGAWLVEWEGVITRVLGAVVILMGLIFIGQFTVLQRTVKPTWAPATGLAGAPLLGIVFAVGWTPCLGPTLAAILSLSLTGSSAWRGALLGLCYCIGLGIPFLLVAFGLEWVAGSMTFLKRHIRAINIAGGVLLIAIGVLMVSGLWSAWMYSLQGVLNGIVTPL